MAEFSWASIQSAEVLEESRAVRFRPEMRDVLAGYFGLGPGMDALEVGCGPGTFAPYLAEIVAPGVVTGLDLDASFIARAEEKAKARGIQGVRYLVGDAYALPFPDASFDAVTSYTGIGVLRDPESAVREMVRVCRSGGSVSIADAVGGPNGIAFDGVDTLRESEPYPGARRLQVLLRRLEAGRPKRPPGVGSRVWPQKAIWGLLGECGLEDVRLSAWGHVMAPDDSRVDKDARDRVRDLEHEQLREWIAWILDAGDLQGMTRTELQEILQLSARRREWASSHPRWEWEASLSIVGVGRKP